MDPRDVRKALRKAEEDARLDREYERPDSVPYSTPEDEDGPTGEALIDAEIDRLIEGDHEEIDSRWEVDVDRLEPVS